MRNTTKLKQILLAYSIGLDMDDDGLFRMSIVEKAGNNLMTTFEGKSYSDVLNKAYRYFLKALKKSG